MALLASQVGCSAPPDDPVGQGAAALTLGAELTLLPDLPGAAPRAQALGREAMAAAGAVRAVAWNSGVSGSGEGFVAIGSEAEGLFGVTSLGSGVVGRPMVLSDGARFLVVWQGSSGLAAARFDATGARLDATAVTIQGTGRAGADGETLAGLFDGTEFVVAYAVTGASAVEVTRVTTAGAVRDRATVPTPSVVSPTRVRIAHATSGYLVAASGDYTSTFAYPQLTYARLGADLAVLDAPARVIATTPRARLLEDVATDGTNYLLVWSDDATPTSGAPRTLVATVAGATGAVGAAVDFGPGTTNPLGEAAWAERVTGGYLIARYAYTGSVFTTRQLLDAGSFVEPAPVSRTLGSAISGRAARVRVGAGLELAWAINSTTPALHTATIGLDGAVLIPAHPALTTMGGTSATDVGLDWDGANFTIAWEESAGAFAARVSRSGERVDVRGRSLGRSLQVNTFASAGGQHGVVVTSDSLAYLRRFSAELSPVGTDTLITSDERRVFTGAGGPLGVAISDMWGSATHELTTRLFRPSGAVTSTVVFTNRSDLPPYGVAESGSLLAVAWIARPEGVTGATSCDLNVSLLLPTGEYAAVPLTRSIGAVAGGCLTQPLRAVSVASDGDGFFVSWVLGPANGSVLGLRVRADGTVVDASPITVAASGGAPTTVWDGASYTVAWPASGDIAAARVDAMGRVLDATPASLGGAGRVGTDFRLASDGAGVLALAYRRVLSDGVTRAQLRLFSWGTLPTGSDAGTDAGGPIVTDAGSDAGVDVPVVMTDAGSDAGTLDAGVDVPATMTDAGSDVPALDASVDVPVSDANT
ncbi:MAG: hypothetical protein R3A52_25185, partial [Polyangiales bacterium]